jgi:hypothetical protein
MNLSAGGAVATATTAVSQPTATSKPANNGFILIGCIAQGTTGDLRPLTGAAFKQANMTPQVCETLCAGYTYAGVENGFVVFRCLIEDIDSLRLALLCRGQCALKSLQFYKLGPNLIIARLLQVSVETHSQTTALLALSSLPVTVLRPASVTQIRYVVDRCLYLCSRNSNEDSWSPS